MILFDRSRLSIMIWIMYYSSKFKIQSKYDSWCTLLLYHSTASVKIRPLFLYSLVFGTTTPLSESDFCIFPTIKRGIVLGSLEMEFLLYTIYAWESNTLTRNYLSSQPFLWNVQSYFFPGPGRRFVGSKLHYYFHIANMSPSEASKAYHIHHFSQVFLYH